MNLLAVVEDVTHGVRVFVKMVKVMISSRRPVGGSSQSAVAVTGAAALSANRSISRSIITVTLLQALTLDIDTSCRSIVEVELVVASEILLAALLDVDYLSVVSLLDDVAVELFTLAINLNARATTMGQTDAGVTCLAVSVGNSRGGSRDLLLSNIGNIEVVVVSVLGDGDGGEGGNFV